MRWYQELKEWQQAIGALLGLLALLGGALYNFWLNRRRDALIKADEGAAVAAAIYGEIILLRRSLAELASLIARRELQTHSSFIEIDHEYVEAHKLPDPHIYLTLTPKLGLLSPEIILGITEFYRNFAQAQRWFLRLAEDESRSYSFSALYFLIPARDGVQKVNPTLRRIERTLLIASAAEEPDMGQTELAIEMEQEAVAASK